MDARLYLVLTPQLCRRGVVETAAAALGGGVDMIQLRDKLSDDAGFLATARELAALCGERGVPFILNDRVHLVERAGADGVHVGEMDRPPEEARRHLGKGAVIGLSTHNREEMAAAAARGVDYVGLGPMFPTETKELTRAPGGAALVRATLGATKLPVFPIGGIDPGNVGPLIAAGARRIAVSSALCSAGDPRAVAEALRSALDEP
jgi:thiamine-phosphate pyrophosphorylase